jgi:hypothetical protein
VAQLFFFFHFTGQLKLISLTMRKTELKGTLTRKKCIKEEYGGMPYAFNMNR